MKQIYKKIKGADLGSGLARLSVIIALIMVWILIDKGNVYGQENIVGKVIKVDTVDDSLFKNGEEGDVRIDDEEGDEFNMRPNPIIDDLVFDFEFTVKTSIPYDIVDALGRLVARGHFEPGISTQAINLSSLRAGLYLVRVEIGSKVDVRRVIKR